MRKYLIIVIIVSIAALTAFFVNKQVWEAKEKERDLAFLNYIPIVRVDEQQVEIYEFGQCKEGSTIEDKAEIGPSSCDRVRSAGRPKRWS